MARGGSYSKDRYTQEFLRGFVRNFFGDSYEELVSFFAKDRRLSVGEVEDILKALREEIRKHKADDHD